MVALKISAKTVTANQPIRNTVRNVLPSVVLFTIIEQSHNLANKPTTLVPSTQGRAIRLTFLLFPPKVCHRVGTALNGPEITADVTTMPIKLFNFP